MWVLPICERTQVLQLRRGRTKEQSELILLFDFCRQKNDWLLNFCAVGGWLKQLQIVPAHGFAKELAGLPNSS